MTSTTRPRPDQRAPELRFSLLGSSNPFDLAQARPLAFSMIVFFRGLHCPVCKGYVKELNDKLDDFERRGVEITAVSMDAKERAERARDEWGIDRLPLGYGLGETTARNWGLYISESIKESEPRRFSEPGLYLIRPNAIVHYAAINSMPFGRPHPDDILSAIQFIQKNDYPARGRVAA